MFELVFVGSILLFLIRILSVCGVVFCFLPHLPLLFGDYDPHALYLVRILAILDVTTPTAEVIFPFCKRSLILKRNYFCILLWDNTHFLIHKSNTYFTESKNYPTHTHSSHLKLKWLSPVYTSQTKFLFSSSNSHTISRQIKLF